MTANALPARVAQMLLMLLLAGAAWFSAAPAADAHALLVSSNPAPGAALTELPKAVTCTFSENVVFALSSVQVLDGSGHVVGKTAPRVASGANALTLGVALPPLLSGVYTVQWKTVSSDDGHVATGSFTFGVGPLAYAAMSGPAPQLLSAPSSATPLAVSGSWLFDSGLGLLVGGCWIAAFGFPAGGRRARILALGGAGVMLVGLAVSGWGEASTDQVGIGELASTSLGLGLIAQAMPATAAAICAAVRRKFAIISALVLAGVTAGAHVLTTHAASGSKTGLELVSEWLHVAAFATWIGGLAALLLTLGAEASAEKAAAVRRFSLVAALSLAALCLSGVVRALDEVGAWHALADTLFGRLVVVKVVLVAMIAVLGAYQRYRSVPSADTSLRKLRRVGTAELGLASMALVAAAILSSSLPPALAQAAPKQPAPPHVVVAGRAPGLRATLDVSPDFPGLNKFTLRVYDSFTGRELSAGVISASTLDFASAALPNDSADPLVTTPTGDGGLGGSGEQLGSTGRWNVLAKIRIRTATVSIPFVVTCNPSPDQIEEMTMGEMVMAYGIQLAGGRQLEAYLTPNRPEMNALHLLFTDQRDAPVSIAGVPDVSVHEVGSASTRQLAMRPVGASELSLLSRGQYFAGTDFTAGRWVFHVEAKEPDGTVLKADFSLTVN